MNILFFNSKYLKKRSLHNLRIKITLYLKSNIENIILGYYIYYRKVAMVRENGFVFRLNALLKNIHLIIRYHNIVVSGNIFQLSVC
jgi:hypothetical protein